MKLQKPKKVQLPNTLISESMCDSQDNVCLIGFMINKAGVPKDVLRQAEIFEEGINGHIKIDKKNNKTKSVYSIMKSVYGWNSRRVENAVWRNDHCKTVEQRVDLLKTELDGLGIKYCKAKS